MTAQQQKLAREHGTPEQFEVYIWKAYEDLFITLREARGVIDGYRAEWQKAGGGKGKRR
jgi:hypothetical protein